MPRHSARGGNGGNRRRPKTTPIPPRKPALPESQPLITPDTLVSLSPVGRAFVRQLLASASKEAGREITNYDMLELMRRVRAELGTDEPDFRIPAHMECMMKNLRALGKEPPTPPPKWAQPKDGPPTQPP